jgi:tetratricopeptide (TPR) repeat protein
VKLPNAYRRLLSVAALFMMLSMFFIRPANAQSEARQVNGAPEQVQHSSDELESLRSKLLELVDTVKDFSETLKPGDVQATNNLSRARTQIEQFSPKQLNSLRASLDPSKMNGGLEDARAVLNDFKPAIQAYYARNSQPVMGKKGMYMENSVGLPSVEGPDAVCQALVGAGRPSSALVIAADAVYMAAKIANVALSRGCEQVAVAVVLGEGGGGNTSLLCVVSDGVLLVAETLRDKIDACDEDYSKRAIDASLARLEHVHTDLENSVSNDNANTATITGALTTASNTITSNDNTNKNTVVANDNTNKNTIVTAISNSQGAIVDNANGNTTALTTAISNTQTSIINNDNTNKNTIVANDNTNKDTIVANDNANKNTIVANDNANAATLTNLLLRLQIEADLAAADSSSPVALFVTPGTTCGASAPLNQCGLLGLVRQIVVQTISNLAGPNASQANSYLAKGDVYRNAGNYAAAYQQYRQAYKAATK